MYQAAVVRLALSGLHLQSCFDHVAGGGEIGSGHASNGAGNEQLEYAELYCGALAEPALFQMGIRRKVDCGKRDVAEQARAGPPVKSKEPQVFHDP